MAKARLDQNLLRKIAEKTNKSKQYVREQISRRASKLGIASEAAQILWAKKLGIGTGSFQRQLEPHVQDQITSTLPIVFTEPKASKQGRIRTKTLNVRQRPDPLRLAIDYLLADEELKRRCADLLKARGSFDRVFREATTVLDDRLKKLAQIRARMNPVALVGRVLHPNNPILIVSTNVEEHEGFFSICKGLMLAFRNPAHHALNDKFARQDALRFCGFVDALLAVLNQAQVNSPQP